MPKQLNVSLTVDADIERAKKKILDLQKSLEKVATAIPKSSKELFNTKALNEASQAALELEKHLRAAVDVNTGKLNLSSFASSLQASGHTLDEYRQKLEAIGTDGSEAFLKLSYNIATAEAPVRKVNATMQNFLTTLKNTARWQISSSILHGFIGAVQSAYSYAQNLNESLNNIRIVTGQSSEQMAEFANRANRAAQALSTTTVRYTDAALIYYQQGIRDQEEIAKRTDTTIKMMNVSGQSAEEASSQMTAIWNNFYDGSKSLEFYADAITALGAATASSSEEIATGIEKFAAVAETVGLSYEYATAALATITAQTRQSADTVGTSLRTLFSRLEGLKLGETLEDGVDLNKYSAALKTIGVDILDVNGELKNMDTILDETAAHWDTLSNAQQVAFAQTVGGVRQYTNLIALMDNWDKMQQNVQIAQNSEGTLQQQADIYAESWEAASTRVRAAMENIYSQLLNDKFFISLNNGLAGLLQGISGAVKGMGGLKGILLTVGNIIAQKYAKEIPSVLNNIKQSFMQITGQAQKMATEMQKQNIKELQKLATDSLAGVQGDSYTMEHAAEAQAYTKLAQLKQEYNEKSNQYSEQEKANIQREISMLELKGQALTNQGSQYDKLRAEVQSMQDVLELEYLDISDIYSAANQIGTVEGNIQLTFEAFRTGKLSIEETKQAIENYISELSKLGADTSMVNEAFVQLFDSSSNTKEGIEALKLTLNDLSKSALANIANDVGMTDAQFNAFIKKCEQLGIEFTINGEKIKNFGNDIKSLPPHISTVSEVITSATGAIMQFSAVLNATKRLGDVFSDKDATTVEKIGAVVGFLTTAIMTFNAVSKLTNTLKSSEIVLNSGLLSSLFGVTAGENAHTASKVAGTAATMGLNAAIKSLLTTLGPLLLVFGAIAGITFGIVKGIEAIGNAIKRAQNQTLEGQLKNAKKAGEELSTSLQECQTEYDNLVNKFDEYQSMYDALYACKQGSDAWKESLEGVQQVTRELLEEFPELASVQREYDPVSGTYKWSDNTIQAQIDARNRQLNIANLSNAMGDVQVNRLETQLQSEQAWDDSFLGSIANSIKDFFATELQLNLDELHLNETQILKMGQDIQNINPNHKDGIPVNQQFQLALEDWKEQNIIPENWGNFNSTQLEGIERSLLNTSNYFGDLNKVFNDPNYLAYINGQPNEKAQSELEAYLQIQAKGQEVDRNLLVDSMLDMWKQAHPDEDIVSAEEINTAVDIFIEAVYGAGGRLETLTKQLASGETTVETLFNELNKANGTNFQFSEMSGDGSEYSYIDATGEKITKTVSSLITDYIAQAVYNAENGFFATDYKTAVASDTLQLKKAFPSKDYDDIIDKYVTGGIENLSVKELEILTDYFNSIDDLAKERRIENNQEALELSKQASLALKDIENNSFQALDDYLSVDTNDLSQSMMHTLTEIGNQFSNGPEGENLGNSIIESILTGLSEYEGTDIYDTLFNGVTKAIEDGGDIGSALSAFFDSQELEIPESLQTLVDLIESANWALEDFTTTQESFNNAFSTFSQLKFNDTLKADDYLTLKESLDDLGLSYDNLFEKQTDGSYKFIGTAEDVKQANQAIVASFQEAKKSLIDSDRIQQRAYLGLKQAGKENVNDLKIEDFYKNSGLLGIADAVGYDADTLWEIWEKGSAGAAQFQTLLERITAYLNGDFKAALGDSDEILASTATTIAELEAMDISEEAKEKGKQRLENEAIIQGKEDLLNASNYDDIRKAQQMAMSTGEVDLRGSEEWIQAVNNVSLANAQAATSFEELGNAFQENADWGGNLSIDQYLRDARAITETNIQNAKTFEELEEATKYATYDYKNTEEYKNKVQELDTAAVQSAKSVEELNQALSNAKKHGSTIVDEDVKTALSSMSMDIDEVIEHLDILTDYDEITTKINLIINGEKDLNSLLDDLFKLASQEDFTFDLSSIIDAAEKSKEFNQPELTAADRAAEFTKVYDSMYNSIIEKTRGMGREVRDTYLEELDVLATNTINGLVSQLDSVEEFFDVLDNLPDMTNMDVFDAEKVYALATSVSELHQLWESGITDASAYGDALTKMAEQYETCTDEINKYKASLDFGSTEDQTNALRDLEAATLAAEDAAKYGLEADAMDDLTDAFMDRNDELAKGENMLESDAEAAADAATRYRRLNDSVDDLAKNYQDYNDVLKKLKSTQAAEEKAELRASDNARKLTKSLAGLLDTSEDLIDNNFLEAIDPEDLEAAANGDEEAIGRIRDAFIDAQAAAHGLADDPALDDFKNRLAELEDGAIIDINNEPFIKKLVESALIAGQSAQEIEDMLSGIGIDCDVTPLEEGLNDAIQMAGNASDIIVEESAINAEDVSQTTTDTDQAEEVEFDEVVTQHPVKSVGDAVLENGATETHPVEQQVTEFHKSVQPRKVTDTETKDNTVHGVRLSNAHKSAGGHVGSSHKNQTGGGGGRGGGGGGGGKERQQKEASKYTPKTPERYHVVTKKMTALSAAQDRLSKKQSTLFGKDYLDSIDATNKLLQKNLNLIKEESDEIDRWLKVDKEKMEAYGAMFDEDGTILNYEEIFNREADKVKAVYDAEKELIDRWNVGDESVTEEMLEQAKKNIEDAEDAFSEFEEALSQYEDTIQKQQENWAKRQEAIIAIQENRYEKIATQLEYQLDIQERSLKILNYYYDKLSDNVYKAAEALRYIYSLNGTDQFDVAFNKLAAYKNATDALTNEYNTPLYDENGNKLSDHSITEANYAEGLQNAIDGVLENLTSINESIRTMQEYYANTLSDVISKISLYTDHMEHLTTVLEHYNTILNLTGQSKAYDKINTILKGQAKTIENTLDADKATYEMLKRQSDLQKAELEAVWADPNHTTNQLILAENEYFAVLQAMDEAHEKMLDSAEAFAEKLQEIYQNDVAKAYEGLEDSITDGMGFDLLNDSLSRLSSLDDEWLTKTNQIYETSSLIKDINKAIDDSTNTATKQKLKLFADEIDALKEKDRLSKFELDLAKARYALLQAQIALEDAQNAKSTVRLRRDNEGNYGYVYTADQNAVNDAEGDLLAAENDLYNMKLNAANEYGQKVIQARQELAEKLKEIDDDLELTEAERNERKALAQKEYFDLIETYSYIYGVATSDDARVVDDAWITTYDDIIRSGGDYKDDIVAYNKDVTDSWNNMFDEINKKMKEVVPELLGDSEGGYGLAELQTAVDDLTTESDEFKTLLTEDVIPALEQELINVDATTQAFSDQLPTIEDMQTYYEKLAQDLNAALNELIALNDTELEDKTATYTINHVDNYYTNNIPTDSISTSTTYPSGSDSGGPGGSMGGTPSGSNMIKSSKPLSTGARPYSNPNYSYNLVNIHNGQRFDTGGYTGSWENGSKLAWLDQKELVLNAQDTENMLMTVSAIRDLNNSINLQALYSTLASGLVAGVYQSAAQTLEQQVSITATFPSVTDHNEIEEALNSLVNRASQYANRYN